MRRFTEATESEHRRSRWLIRAVSWSVLAGAVIAWGLLSGSLSLRTPESLKFHVWVPAHRTGLPITPMVPEAPGYRPPGAPTDKNG